MLNLREQFNYVNKVVKNCQTQKQKNNAHRWAYDWAKRMKSNYPNEVYSYIDLYLDVIYK
tara:strand:+ start:516 stop:695 length:180 start_codon:yes stop_codon:yes gene_type:complete